MRTFEATVRGNERLRAEQSQLKKERDELQRENKILRKRLASSLANNLCPDHRDKQVGKPCLACEVERLQKLLSFDNQKILDRVQQIVDECGLPPASS